MGDTRVRREGMSIADCAMTEYRQDDFFAPPRARTPEAVCEFLLRPVGGRRSLRLVAGIDLKLTRNRVSMITIEFPLLGRVRLRMHRAFLSAPESVLASLRDYLRTRRRSSWRDVAAFARNIPAEVRAPARPRTTAGARGRVYDLDAIARDVRNAFFNGKARADVKWGRDRLPSRRGRRSRSIRFGSWDGATRTVRVHPRLDDERVPAEFVHYIVYHELLHSVVPPERKGGRVYHHTRTFRALERQFPDYERMRILAGDLLELLT